MYVYVMYVHECLYVSIYVCMYVPWKGGKGLFERGGFKKDLRSFSPLICLVILILYFFPLKDEGTCLSFSLFV